MKMENEQILENKLYVRALIRAAVHDRRFICVRNPIEPSCYTYINLSTKEPELYLNGSTAEEAFALKYNLDPDFNED
jgi:hypothetical protein